MPASGKQWRNQSAKRGNKIYVGLIHLVTEEVIETLKLVENKQIKLTCWIEKAGGILLGMPIV